MMKERTLQILQALVNDFVETANPVASKRLLESNVFDVSSATVRNEFALLEEVGFIASPHISAGKIPTQKGYRFFVDQFMEDEKMLDQTESLVASLFKSHIDQYRISKSKETIIDALRIISELSGNVAFASIDQDSTFYIGLSQVLRSPEFASQPEKAAQIVEVLEGRERFQKLVQNLEIPHGEVKIFIGEENLLEEISSCAMLVTKFENQNTQGFLGILGPMRMQYGFNKALLKQSLDLIF